MTKPDTVRNILIGSMRRSGGTLLGNLFGGHSSCHVYPFEHWHTESKATYNRRAALIFRFLGPEEKLIACGMGPAFEAKIDGQHGPGTWRYIRPQVIAIAARSPTPARFFVAFSLFYFREVSGEESRPWIVNHCANVALLGPRRLGKIFGRQSEIVLSIRDPRATFASMKKLRRSQAKGAFQAAELRQFCADWRQVFRLHRSGQAHGVTFENLLASPGAVMRKLTDSLGLAFEDTLLRPTVAGKPVSHNSSFLPEGEGQGKIRTEPLTRWKSSLEAEETAAIEGLLEREMKEAGYL